jgi:hypothetical protein
MVTLFDQDYEDWQPGDVICWYTNTDVYGLFLERIQQDIHWITLSGKHYTTSRTYLLRKRQEKRQ